MECRKFNEYNKAKLRNSIKINQFWDKVVAKNDQNRTTIKNRNNIFQILWQKPTNFSLIHWQESDIHFRKNSRLRVNCSNKTLWTFRLVLPPFVDLLSVYCLLPPVGSVKIPQCCPNPQVHSTHHPHTLCMCTYWHHHTKHFFFITV